PRSARSGVFSLVVQARAHYARGSSRRFTQAPVSQGRYLSKEILLPVTGVIVRGRLCELFQRRAVRGISKCLTCLRNRPLQQCLQRQSRSKPLPTSTLLTESPLATNSPCRRFSDDIGREHIVGCCAWFITRRWPKTCSVRYFSMSGGKPTDLKNA